MFFDELRAVSTRPDVAFRDETTARAADVTAARFTEAERDVVRMVRSFIVVKVYLSARDNGDPRSEMPAGCLIG